MPETITPAVPPTPPVPLQALLAREDLALRQIAGPADPQTVIHWAHTSEMADPYPYLLGGELLLTAGVHVPEAAGTGTYFDDYVGRIVAAGGAALGFGLAPVHDTVPRALVAACDRYGLPLLEVPPQTTFSGVARAVWQLMAQARLAELRRVTEAQQSLAAAASRPDPVPAVLRQLAQRLGGRAVLYGPDGTEVASVASVLLSLLTGEHQSGSGAARSSALVRVLLGAAPEEVAPLLGAAPWRVVHARPESQLPDTVAASALGAALGSPLVDLAGEVVRVLVPAGREPEPQPGWTLGVSAAAGPPEWPAADTQAARALARARATRAPLVRHAARPALADLVPPADAETHARTLLAPLDGQPALAETLRTWLSLHGSWDRTAVALDVHRNTVRQRIARCAALLAADLDDPDVRMELWFALRRT
ncbi:PucR family transcriptional regulator [Streptomyces tricolor]|uniref:PucR family transcriptional regulator n=1 Tax=Streptomyces tricolor TaxID=68277 RepID=A0ABS9JJZ5_9ACTN|nr:PucR family transcriptional regulator [Streptomyces tricolor]MCG0065880.1 PucR family transcriptional regulator [Streptomyces tricolor]